MHRALASDITPRFLQKMTLSEIEQWSLREVRRPVLQESDRVEFKSQVTDPVKLARQIAGHANSARGEWILWILGVDDKLGLVGIPGLEWAKLWPQIESCFNGNPPRPVIVSFQENGKTLTAVAFETTLPPYVVSNPNHDRLEVPWREGTRVRSARHSDLLLLLGSTSAIPEMEIVRTSPLKRRDEFVEPRANYSFEADLYFIPKSRNRVAIRVELSEISISFTEEYADEEAVDAKLKSVQLGALLTGPGMGEVLRHYNEGVLASAAADAILAFAKVFEYVSATIVRDRLINRARQKLMSPRARRPDSSFIQELQELFEAERANRQDRAAITLTARVCCDAEELRLLAPECCRKLRQLATSANERDREAALENFADCLVSTRNVFSHAKANFEPTGSECPTEQLDQFRICLRVAAQQAIHYFYGLHPDKRVL